MPILSVVFLYTGQTMSNIALITGITGQDGSYLARLLLGYGYEVHGIKRRTSNSNFDRIQDMLPVIKMHDGDITDAQSISKIVGDIKPNEFYNLASQSFVPSSFTSPKATIESNGIGVLNCLEAILDRSPDTKFYQASSSEIFGKVDHEPQTEDTKLNPVSPYACAKAYGHMITGSYRMNYGLFACSGICYNHESEFRGLQFVTRKITHSIAKIVHGLQDELYLGNLDSVRDWGYAGDFVRAMWMILQSDSPGDYIIATGVKHSVREFVSIAFKHAGLDYNNYVKVDPKFFRNVDVNNLCGDIHKIRSLGWLPSVGFEDLVKRMVDYDLRLVSKGIDK